MQRDNFYLKMGTGLRKASADMAEYARMNQGSPLLMQHAENRGQGGRPGRGNGNGGGNGRGNGRGKGNRREGERGNSEQPEEK